MRDEVEQMKAECEEGLKQIDNEAMRFVLLLMSDYGAEMVETFGNEMPSVRSVILAFLTIEAAVVAVDKGALTPCQARDAMHEACERARQTMIDIASAEYN